MERVIKGEIIMHTEIYPNEMGEIIIRQSQPEPLGDPDNPDDVQHIVIRLDQVEQVCEWLTEIKKEMEAKEK